MNRKNIAEELSFLKPRATSDGMAAFDCPPDRLLEAARALKERFECQTLTDIASVDMGLSAGEGRFGCVYHFFSHTKKFYVRLAAMCRSAAEPRLPSLTGVYPSADWLEREAFDLMGITFDCHPRLRRILMWEGYPYHPLRKDFPLAGLPAPLPDTFEGNEDATKVVPAPEEGGPFHSASESSGFSPQREPRSWEGKPGGR